MERRKWEEKKQSFENKLLQPKRLNYKNILCNTKWQQKENRERKTNQSSGNTEYTDCSE